MWKTNVLRATLDCAVPRRELRPGQALTWNEVIRAGNQFGRLVRVVKKATALEDKSWYPYQSMAGLHTVRRLVEGTVDLSELITAGPIVDVGCGDGEMAIFFNRLGCEIDAIDHSGANMNSMVGVKKMAEIFESGISIHDLDLDGCRSLPRTDYGLAICLGLLYHLKNPFRLLEMLASSARYCILSTRIFRALPGRLEDLSAAPIAYLAGPGEVNHDHTNYWMLTPAALSRLTERSGWATISVVTAGFSDGSEPVDVAKDERMFCLLESKRFV